MIDERSVESSISRIKSACNALQKLGIDAFLLNLSDEFFSEFLDPGWKQLEFLTNFTGSYAYLILWSDESRKLAFFTDARYVNQAKMQLVSSLFEIFDTSDCDFISWAARNFDNSVVFAYDTRTISHKHASAYSKLQCTVVPLEYNPVDNVWNDKPTPIIRSIFMQSNSRSGKTAAEKLPILVDVIQKNSANAYFLANKESVSWLFNLRCRDFLFNPAANVRAIVYDSSEVELYVSDYQVDVDIHFSDCRVNFFPLSKLRSRIACLGRFLFDCNNTPDYFLRNIGNAEPVHCSDPCLYAKAIKNSTEINMATSAHIDDGLAIILLLHYIDTSGDKLDEVFLLNKLKEFRFIVGSCIGESFPTISAFSKNAAIIHYNPIQHESSVSAVEPDGLYLLDCGGQYPGATTDVTRTICIGKPTPDQVSSFTNVLKSFISLAKLSFPVGTTGSHLYAISNACLWNYGYICPHSIGHGVGSELGVHEGPHAISKSNFVPLKPGMFVTNEPGYYLLDHYGIRIENMMRVVEKGDAMMEFMQLTCVPIDKKLIDVRCLSKDEIDWLNSYHGFVYDRLQNRITDDSVKEWLYKACSDI